MLVAMVIIEARALSWLGVGNMRALGGGGIRLLDGSPPSMAVSQRAMIRGRSGNMC